jgi:Cupin
VQFCTVLTEHYGFEEQMEAKLDPITDIFRTLHVTAFGQHRLEATAPWGLIQEKQTEEKVTPSDKKISPKDLAHFAMLSRGNCWLSVEGIPEPIPLTGGDCILLARGTSIVLRDSPRTRPRSTFREIAADNRLWLHEFRSRQPEADHSVIAELHSD